MNLIKIVMMLKKEFLEFFDMSEIARVHTLILQFKASKRFPSMLKNTLRTLVRSVFDIKEYKMHSSEQLVIAQYIIDNKELTINKEKNG